MRVCSRPDCKLAGVAQPDTAFYPGKYECIRCARIYGRKAHERSRERMRTSPFEVDREPRIRLDGDPWRDFLNRQLDLHAIGELARLMGTSERIISRWLNESDHVCLDAIDRALCAFGEPGLLHVLYPGLFDVCEQCGRVGMHSKSCELRPMKDGSLRPERARGRRKEAA